MKLEDFERALDLVQRQREDPSYLSFKQRSAALERKAGDSSIEGSENANTHGGLNTVPALRRELDKLRLKNKELFGEVCIILYNTCLAQE